MNYVFLASIDNLKMENIEDVIWNFNWIQEKSLLETALLMGDLYEYKRMKGNHITKWIYVKNKKVFIKKFEEKFDNDKKTIKNFIKIYLQSNEMITFEGSDGD